MQWLQLKYPLTLHVPANTKCTVVQLVKRFVAAPCDGLSISFEYVWFLEEPGLLNVSDCLLSPSAGVRLQSPDDGLSTQSETLSSPGSSKNHIYSREILNHMVLPKTFPPIVVFHHE